MSDKIELVRWEGDEFIIEVNGQPVGCTLTKGNGENILNWLRSYFQETKRKELI